MFPYDPTLLAALQNTPKSIAEVVDRLKAIDAACVDGDGLKWFNRVYLQVTEAVAERVAEGGFADPAWMAALDVNFANLYLDALRSNLSGESAPECWEILFAARDQVALARIQVALAGMNAHINHDLAEAIVTTCQATGRSPEHGGNNYDDFTALNSTLNSLIESAKKTLHVRLLGEVLPPVATLEDTLAAWNLAAAREGAWLNAGHLWALRNLPGLDESFVDMLDGMSTVIGKVLLIPVA